jgi:hypothetical protein
MKSQRFIVIDGAAEQAAEKMMIAAYGKKARGQRACVSTNKFIGSASFLCRAFSPHDLNLFVSQGVLPRRANSLGTVRPRLVCIAPLALECSHKL